MSRRAGSVLVTPFALLAAFAVGLTASVSCADLPTIEEIVAIDRANRKALSELHIQVRQSYEETEALAIRDRSRAAKFEAQRRSISVTAAGETQVELDGKKVTGAEAEQAIQDHGLREPRTIQFFGGMARARATFQGSAMEIFQRGNEYQVRTAAGRYESAEGLLAWRFPNQPITVETLLSDYSNVRIFSHSPANTPPSRNWGPSLDGRAYVTRKHATEVSYAFWPPYLGIPDPSYGPRSILDNLLSHPRENYRVVGYVEEQGRRLTIVDLRTRSESGNQHDRKRIWIDLERGAIPVRIREVSASREIPEDWHERLPPTFTTTVEGIQPLPGGGYYPTRIVVERWEPTEIRRLTAAEINDYWSGRFKVPLAVTRRMTWEFPLIEIPARWDDGFFALPFPEGQEVYDTDEQRTIGEIPLSPLVQVGQPAPPWTVARWLDGKTRTLADFRGQVVVLDFMTSRDGRLEEEARRNQALRERFRGKAVTFVSLCMAERDPADSEQKMAAVMKETGWASLVAIDSGRMIHDSATMRAYGVQDPSFRVIIGADGRIADVDPAPLEGEPDEEDPIALAAFEKSLDSYKRKVFEIAEEPYPPPANLTEEEELALYRRVGTRYEERRIEKVLEAAAAAK